MKKCAKCSYENSDESKFCEDCGAQEFTPIASEVAEGVAIGDNSAISAGELVSGGKNNTTNNTTTTNDNSSTTHISHGASAEDMASILKVVMQENSNIIKQVLEHQQQAAPQQSVAEESEKKQSTSEMVGNLSPNSSGGVASKDDSGEYDLVMENLVNSVMSLIGRVEALKAPDRGYFLRKYYFVMWIVATIFLFFMAASTAISVLWIAVLASLVMSLFTAFRRFKSSEAEPKRVEMDGYLKEFAEIRSTIVSAIGEDNDFVRLSDAEIGKIKRRFEAGERNAMKGARRTTLLVCGGLIVLGWLIVKIVIA